MKNSSQSLLELVNHVFVSHPELRQSIENIIFKEWGASINDIKFLLSINALNLSKSKAQYRQDLFVLSQVNFKREGFFVEFGGTNGIEGSNSYLLEKEYGWNGILAEPAKSWHADLRKNRSCHIEDACVWSESGRKLVFNEPAVAAIATINDYSDSDFHAKARENGLLYEVGTISLNDLLEKYGAPTEIDYLSVDTEGSEFEILSNFDFSRHTFRCITCEHNYTPMRERIFELLTSNGYIRVFESVSLFDDWYVKSRLEA
jgi:FkbM family methyltransferase